MAYRVRVFVDFWNFQLSWNAHYGPHTRCDWRALPRVLMERTREELRTAGVSEELQLEETRVYASIDPKSEGDARLSRWLNDFLDRQPSVRVFSRPRVAVRRIVRCRKCRRELRHCDHCGEVLTASIEKGIDTAIVTDLLALAWEAAYDIAILISSDADMIPGVEHIQARGLKVVNATWPPKGVHLARVCWASFPIPQVYPQLVIA
ncbi:MAG: NYN domain-containing protein [Armatimonadetes bacterium]|nr:NYN domain-containing protein [Armatimonadota bacterium]